MTMLIGVGAKKLSGTFFLRVQVIIVLMILKDRSRLPGLDSI
jgi:hypothetical protein